MYSGDSPTGNGLMYPIESSTSGVVPETRQNVQIKILPMPIPIGIPVQVHIQTEFHIFQILQKPPLVSNHKYGQFYLSQTPCPHFCHRFP